MSAAEAGLLMTPALAVAAVALVVATVSDRGLGRGR
jgi:hypothetical protein